MKYLIATVLTAFIGLVGTPVYAEDSPVTAASEITVLYVDINNDSAEKMADLLKGVGIKKAQAIVDYRNEFGAFMAPEDLLNVKGIGPSTLEKNRASIKMTDMEG